MTALPVETVLRDGTPAMIWPLLPTDGESLRHAFGELSPQSRRWRFLGPVDHLDDAMLHLLIDAVDGRHHIALTLVVFPPDEVERPVGVARLVQLPEDPSTADFAVTVVDEWQGRGVGGALAEALLRLRPSEVRRLETEVATTNTASLALLRRLGAVTTRPVYPGVLDVVVDLSAVR